MKFSRIGRFFIKALVWIFLGLLISGFAAYSVFRLPAVQSYLTKQLTHRLSNDLDTKVSLSGIQFRIFDEFILNDFFLQDQQGDTLLYAKQLWLSLSYINLATNHVGIESISLESCQINLTRAKDSLHFNHHFLLAKLNGGVDTNAKPLNWHIELDAVRLRDIDFLLDFPP